MILLVLGVLATSLIHLVAAVPALKAGLKARIGERAYGPVFGVASLVGLVIIVIGWQWTREVEFIDVYDPPEWGRHVNYLLTLIGFICLGIFLFRGSFRQKLRFPMAIAAMFWATGHLFANGDLASVVLFGGFLAYAIAHIVIASANGIRPSPEVRQGHDLVSVLAGLALYGVMTQLHPVLIGVPVFPLS
jgi:uncharacterized membrane protein